MTPRVTGAISQMVKGLSKSWKLLKQKEDLQENPGKLEVLTLNSECLTGIHSITEIQPFHRTDGKAKAQEEKQQSLV